MVKIIPYSPAYLASYQDLAKRSWWGKNCYQQTEKYLDWLYTANPYKNTECPFLLVIEPQSNAVVGVIHKMRLPWLIDGQKVIVSAIHNLFVEEKYRQGCGLMLITASLKGETNVLCPGVLPPLSEAYRMLRFQEIDALRFRKFILPLGSKKIRAQKITNPSDTQISDMIRTLNNKSGNHILWDTEIFKWRFLQGPKHIFLWEDEQNFLILFRGKRKGLNIVRIIDGNIDNPDSTLWTDMLNCARSLGAVCLLGYCADSSLKKYFLSKIKPRRKTPLVFFYHRDKQAKEMNFNASAGDSGFEGLNS